MELQINKIDDLKWIGEIDIPSNDIWTGNQIIKKQIVCDFEYYKDMYNQIWVNKIFTNGNFQEKGYGTLMIKKALEEYGVIYFPNASEFECKNYSKDIQNDFRYTNTLTFEESNLGLFSKSLLKNKIIHKSWIKNPFL